MAAFMKRVRFIWSMVFWVIVLGTTLHVAAQGSGTIDILTVNDFHGQLIGEFKNPGAIKLAAFLHDLREQNPDGTIILSAGDMFQGTQESNLTYGEPVVEWMNQVGFDAMALGNHEFDWGMDCLRQRMKQAHFPFLAANVLPKQGINSSSLFSGYVMLERQGIRIAVIGLATPETVYTTKPAAVQDLTFEDPAQTVKNLVPVLRAQGAEIVIVLSHIACEQDPQTKNITGPAAEALASVSSVQAWIGGHSHRRVAGMINGVPLVQALYSGRCVGHIRLQYDKTAGTVTPMVAEVLDTPLTEAVSGNPSVVKLVSQVQQQVEQLNRQPLGRLKSGLAHDRMMLSLLGMWVTDIMRRSAQADIALQNGGGLRTDLPAGAVTVGKLYEVLPFDNTLVTLELTGLQVQEVLEYGIANQRFGMLQFSGLVVHYDQSLPAGQRVVSVQQTDGTPLNPSRSYRIVTNDFMAQGGDGFTMLRQGTNMRDSGILLRDIIQAELQKHEQECDPVLQQRLFSDPLQNAA